MPLIGHTEPPQTYLDLFDAAVSRMRAAFIAVGASRISMEAGMTHGEKDGWLTRERDGAYRLTVNEKPETKWP